MFAATKCYAALVAAWLTWPIHPDLIRQTPLPATATACHPLSQSCHTHCCACIHRSLEWVPAWPARSQAINFACKHICSGRSPLPAAAAAANVWTNNVQILYTRIDVVLQRVDMLIKLTVKYCLVVAHCRKLSLLVASVVITGSACMIEWETPRVSCMFVCSPTGRLLLVTDEKKFKFRSITVLV